MSNFWGLLFKGFFWKIFRVRTEKLHKIKVNKSFKKNGKYFLRGKPQFFRTKNSSVSTKTLLSVLCLLLLWINWWGTSSYVPKRSDTSKEGQRKKGSVPSGQLLLLPGCHRAEGTAGRAVGAARRGRGRGGLGFYDRIRGEERAKSTTSYWSSPIKGPSINNVYNLYVPTIWPSAYPMSPLFYN